MRPYTMTEAEADLRAAINTCDEAAITTAGAHVDRLDVHPVTVTLHSAALYYASIGLRVFPLQPGTKIPYGGTHGCLDATTDTDTINTWWTRTPDANVAVATGHLVDVVDVDGHTGQQSRAQHWDNIFAKIDADSIGRVLTPRIGGMHLYVRATGMGNSTNIAPSVDYRGVGGYVVAPPSRTEQGRYRWLGTPNLDALKASA